MNCRPNAPDGTGRNGSAGLRHIRGKTLMLPGILRSFPATFSLYADLCRATVRELLNGADFVGQAWTVAG